MKDRMQAITQVVTLETERLILRQWKSCDLTIFAELNSDAETMAFFPNTLSTNASNALADKCQSLIAKRGWGLWAAELKTSSEFMGFVGLHEVSSAMPFYPSVEIGWRLHKDYWGNGFATEAATKVLSFAFQTLMVNDVVSFTTVSNTRSCRVMTRLGLIDTEQNFLHPNIAKDHPQAEHVLYQITEKQWRACSKA